MSSHLSQERERQGMPGFRSDDGVDATPRTAGSAATRDSPESRAALRDSQPIIPRRLRNTRRRCITQYLNTVTWWTYVCAS
jgi:hypothetical protein